MPNMRILIYFLLLGIASAQTSEQVRFFDDRVEPILRTRCLGCHNDELNGGGISFNDPEGLLRGGNHGPAIVPGKPKESLLIEVVLQDGDIKMPPGGKLSGGDVAILTEWINSGAVWGTKLRISPEEKAANLLKRCYTCHRPSGTR